MHSDLCRSVTWYCCLQAIHWHSSCAMYCIQTTPPCWSATSIRFLWEFLLGWRVLAGSKWQSCLVSPQSVTSYSSSYHLATRSGKHLVIPNFWFVAWRCGLRYSMVWAMGSISTAHIYRMITDYGGFHLDFTG